MRGIFLITSPPPVVITKKSLNSPPIVGLSVTVTVFSPISQLLLKIVGATLNGVAVPFPLSIDKFIFPGNDQWLITKLSLTLLAPTENDVPKLNLSLSVV